MSKDFPLQTCYGIEPLNIEGPLRVVPQTQFDSILDLGCGGGRTAIYLELIAKCKFKAVYGCDFEENMLEKYQHTVHQFNLFDKSEFRLFCCGFQNITLPNESIHFVTSYTAFHHSPQDEAKLGLKTASRLLRPDGYLCLWNAFTKKLWTEDEIKSAVANAFGDRAFVFWHHGYWHVLNQRFAQLTQFTIPKS